MMSRKIRLDFTPRTKPLPHQIEAIRQVTDNDCVPLFDEQGLGKSKTVIDALVANMESGTIDAVLVIAKKSLVQMWYEEVMKHSHLFPVLLTGSKTSDQDDS